MPRLGSRVRISSPAPISVRKLKRLKRSFGTAFCFRPQVRVSGKQEGSTRKRSSARSGELPRSFSREAPFRCLCDAILDPSGAFGNPSALLLPVAAHLVHGANLNVMVSRPCPASVATSMRSRALVLAPSVRGLARGTGISRYLLSPGWNLARRNSDARS